MDPIQKPATPPRGSNHALRYNEDVRNPSENCEQQELLSQFNIRGADIGGKEEELEEEGEKKDKEGEGGPAPGPRYRYDGALGHPSRTPGYQHQGVSQNSTTNFFTDTTGQLVEPNFDGQEPSLTVQEHHPATFMIDHSVDQAGTGRGLFHTGRHMSIGASSVLNQQQHLSREFQVGRSNFGQKYAQDARDEGTLAQDWPNQTHRQQYHWDAPPFVPMPPVPQGAHLRTKEYQTGVNYQRDIIYDNHATFRGTELVAGRPHQVEFSGDVRFYGKATFHGEVHFMMQSTFLTSPGFKGFPPLFTENASNPGLVRIAADENPPLPTMYKNEIIYAGPVKFLGANRFIEFKHDATFYGPVTFSGSVVLALADFRDQVYFDRPATVNLQTLLWNRDQHVARQQFVGGEATRARQSTVQTAHQMDQHHDWPSF